MLPRIALKWIEIENAIQGKRTAAGRIHESHLIQMQIDSTFNQIIVLLLGRKNKIHWIGRNVLFVIKWSKWEFKWKRMNKSQNPKQFPFYRLNCLSFFEKNVVCWTANTKVGEAIFIRFGDGELSTDMHCAWSTEWKFRSSANEKFTTAEKSVRNTFEQCDNRNSIFSLDERIRWKSLTSCRWHNQIESENSKWKFE